jgi:hypothetical protein
MAAATHRDDEAVLLRELHRPLNVCNRGAARNQRRSPINISVPHPPSHFVTRVLGMDQLAAKALPQILKVRGVERAAICLKVARSQHRHVGTSNRVAG